MVDWQGMSDEEILRIRIRDLGLRLEASPIEPMLQQLYSELDSKGINFHPSCYLADEWFCPDKTPIIGIPFFLAHRRLKQIEKKMIFEVEGGKEKSFMKLLRHECGHAVNYAYELYKKTRWRQLFGPFSTKYTNSYYFQPYSKRYVVHLRDGYGQSHPDEDFAETFAVWLGPENNWQNKYKDWPAMKKLRYVDTLMKRTGQQKPQKTFKGQPPFSASRMTSTLAAYYQRKQRELGDEFQGFYDNMLKELFTINTSETSDVKASVFLRRYRVQLVNCVSRWTTHRKYDIHQLVNNLISRCNVLGLYVKQGQADDIVAVSVFLTVAANKTFKLAKKY